MMNSHRHGPVSIDILPDEAFLEIFTFYRTDLPYLSDDKTTSSDSWWRTLVHVCRRWRYIVFESPRRLNLRLVCTGMTPVRKMLNIWPTLPLVISVDQEPSHLVGSVDNITTALQHTDRICEISFRDIPTSLLERLTTEMQRPLPDLTSLCLKPLNETSPPLILADSFLGGSVPRLRTLMLRGITLPSLRSFLLSSANDLVTLHLERIPHPCYISPEVMVTCLSTIPNLRELRLGFQSPLSRPDQASRRPLPLQRAGLPLTYFDFKGVSEYLEDFVAQIDLPLLDRIRITFFNRLIFDTPNLRQFFSRTKSLGPVEQVDLHFGHYCVEVQVSPRQDLAFSPPRLPKLTLEVSCTNSDWQLSSVVQVCASTLPPLSTTEQLRVYCFGELHWRYDIEGTQWLELLRPFTAVKDLHIYDDDLALRVATSLQQLAKESAEEVTVLPVLRHFSTTSWSTQSENFQGSIRKFVRNASTALIATEFCPFPDCWKQTNRRQETQRHVHQHLPHSLHCNQPDCAWTGNRLEALRRHFKKMHPGAPFPEHDEITIYDAKGLVARLLHGDITMEQAVHWARFLFQSKAAELGKLGIWRE